MIPVYIFGQDVKLINFNDFNLLTERNNDSTYVYNFWATWCMPCVKEIAYFEKIDSLFRKKKVRVELISLDFKRDMETRLKPFIKKHGIKANVYLLSDFGFNKWISSIDSLWSGAIPATLVINKNRNYKKFYEQEFSFEQLVKTVEAANRF